MRKYLNLYFFSTVGWIFGLPSFLVSEPTLFGKPVLKTILIAGCFIMGYFELKKHLKKVKEYDKK